MNNMDDLKFTTCGDFLDSQQKSIAFLPLDIPKIDFDIDLIESHYFEKHTLWPDTWNCLPILGKTKHFDQKSFHEAWVNRKEPGDVHVNPAVDKQLAHDILNLLFQMPFECTSAQILNQQEYVIPHKDAIDYSGPMPKQIEPQGFKILLNPTLERSFFVAKEEDSRREFVRMPPTTNCFVINENDFYHGAKVPKKQKYLVSCFGDIDPIRHEELITRSLEKYGEEYGIFF